MKKVWSYIAILVLTMMPQFSQQEDLKIREEVSVVNVEVPVRVFYKGKPVENLMKSDFKLYEDGKLREINGFYLKKKKINIQDYELTAKGEKEIFPARYFVLVYNLVEYHRNLMNGLDYVLDNILRETDQLMVMVNKKILFFNNLSAKRSIRRQIQELMAEQGKLARARMLNLVKRVSDSVLELKTLLKMDGDSGPKNPKQEKFKDTSSIVRRFLNNYYQTWKNFKQRYLMPSVDDFYYFAKHLEGIKKEKWVINFYQVVSFPQFKTTSESLRELKKFLDTRTYHKMNFDMKAETEFPAEDVSKLFYKVNATFHSVLIPTLKDIVSEDLEYKAISTALENCLRAITAKTGGKLIFSADLVSAMDTLSEKEDIYYILTYEPENAQKTGRIRIEVADKKYKAVYDKNIRAAYIRDYLERKKVENPDIKIEQILFENRELFLLINDFLLKQGKKESKGQLDLLIRVEDKDGQIIFHESKKLTPTGKMASISINFDWLKQGDYYILADVRDELTGNTSLEYVQAAVTNGKTKLKKVVYSESEEEPEQKENAAVSEQSSALDNYLRGCAEYCAKLKQEVFHFYCTEKITLVLEHSDLDVDLTGSSAIIQVPSAFNSVVAKMRKPGTYLSRIVKENIKQVKKFLFDYQIMSNRGEVTEQRRLISGKDKNLNLGGKELQEKITSFLTERAVFGPDTLLSKERQGKFDFKLIKFEKYKKRRFAVIEAIPKNTAVSFSYGKVWIDSEDYSVRKIKVDPRSIAGYEKLRHLAKQLQAKLFLTCEIEYDKLHKGLRFPTNVTITETYKGGPYIIRNKGNKGWERSKTTFNYRNYQFFGVDARVKSSGIKKE